MNVQNDVSWNSSSLGVRPEVAISHYMGHNPDLKVYSVVPDGKVWRWRCTYPNNGKLGSTSTQAFATYDEASRTMQNVAHCTRPSICLTEAWQGVPADAGQPEHMRDGWVGA